MKKKRWVELSNGGYGLDQKNDMEKALLDFTEAFDLMIANMEFEKRSHLLTFKRKSNMTP